MKVALTAWEDRISPVFDAARTLLIAEVENGEIVKRQHVSFFPEMSWRLAGTLNEMEIDVLICGAISQFPAGVIENSGIQLIPFVSGNVENVLDAYAAGDQLVPAFSMPGCGWRHGRRKGRHGKFDTHKEVTTMPRGDKTGPRGTGPGSGKGRGGCNNGQGGTQPGSGQGQGKGQGQGPGRGQGQGQGRGPGKGRGQGRGNRQ